MYGVMLDSQEYDLKSKEINYFCGENTSRIFIYIFWQMSLFYSLRSRPKFLYIVTIDVICGTWPHVRLLACPASLLSSNLLHAQVLKLQPQEYLHKLTQS